MYLKTIVITLFLLGSTILIGMFPVHSTPIVLEQPENTKSIVIELFTSQGCSSCPSADRLLSELIDQSEAGALPVYALSFHVDYWNRLGWKDPYSRKAYTDRQYSYARKMGKGGVYTPQMVVNGTDEFVGSSKSQADRAIRTAQTRPSKGSINIDRISIDSHQLKLSYQLAGIDKNSVINIALVERGIRTKVTRGENGGRELHHDNVVRSFTKKVWSATDEALIDLPENLDLTQSSIVVYAQDIASYEIQSASSVSLNNLIR